MDKVEYIRKIAKTKGLKTYSFPEDPVPLVWIVGKKGPETPVDYVDRWNNLGPLVLELAKAGWNFHWDDQFEDWRWMKLKGRNDLEDISNKSFGMATCEAYLIEFGDKHQWKNIDDSPGLYDTTYKCVRCGVHHTVSADNINSWLSRIGHLKCPGYIETLSDKEKEVESNT